MLPKSSHLIVLCFPIVLAAQQQTIDVDRILQR
jgi:hypothetical protein